jgi:Na+/H+ antiporter
MADAFTFVGIAATIVILVALANRLQIAYPIVLVLGGLAIGFIPGVPRISLPPDVLLIVVLPGLLYWEAVTAPTGEFRAYAVPIFALAVGLVLATTVAVALVAHAIVPGMPWAVAFVLGAVVSSTDEVAFTPVAERLQLPRHVIAIIEGESLINDATSLVLYAVAVGAVVTGSFSLTYAGLYFVSAAAASVAIGIAAGWIIVQAWRAIRDTSVQAIISIIAPFTSYLPAQALGVSAVLAVVTTGLFVSRYTPFAITPETRVRATGFWNTIVFVLNAFIFVLVGIQFHAIVGRLSRFAPVALIEYGVAVSLTVIVLRLAWTLAQGLLPSFGPKQHAGSEWAHLAIEAWSGMRGGVSLAAALAIPLMAGSARFPDRSLIIFLTFCVLLATLVGQGGTLPFVIRWLGIVDDGADVREQRFALACTARVALERLHELARGGAVPPEIVAAIEGRYAQRKREFGAMGGKTGDSAGSYTMQLDHEIERRLIDAERVELVALRDRGTIDNTVMRRVQFLLDIEQIKLDLLDAARRTDVDAES